MLPNRYPRQSHVSWGGCFVCGDRGTGRHYGVLACEGCKGFFKRSIRAKLSYDCLAQSCCPIDKENRNRCQKCRLDKCLRVGMIPAAVQCERRPVAAPARKKQRRVGPSYGCGQRAATGPSPTGSRLFMPQDLGLQVAAKIPSPPPAAASRPFILEPPVCGPDALGPGQVGSDGVRDSRSSDSVPPLPAASHISPEPRGMQRQTPLTFSCWALSREHLNLKLDLPAFHVPTTSVNYIYELATNLLDQSVDWACTVPAFRSLQEHDRLALLQHSWSDLVLLGAAQCSRAFPKTAFVNLGMHAHRNHLEKAKGDRIAGQVMAIKGFISTLKGLNMDGVEYGYLKAAALFKPDAPTLSQPGKVHFIQGFALRCLKDYTEQKNPGQPERFVTLLLHQPAKVSIGVDSVEEVFFASWVRHGRITTLLADILSNRKTELHPTGHMGVGQ